MYRVTKMTAVIAAMLVAPVATAHEFKIKDFDFIHPWTREPASDCTKPDRAPKAYCISCPRLASVVGTAELAWGPRAQTDPQTELRWLPFPERLILRPCSVPGFWGKSLVWGEGWHPSMTALVIN